MSFGNGVWAPTAQDVELLSSYINQSKLESKLEDESPDEIFDDAMYRVSKKVFSGQNHRLHPHGATYYRPPGASIDQGIPKKLMWPTGDSPPWYEEPATEPVPQFRAVAPPNKASAPIVSPYEQDMSMPTKRPTPMPTKRPAARAGSALNPRALPFKFAG